MDQRSELRRHADGSPPADVSVIAVGKQLSRDLMRAVAGLGWTVRPLASIDASGRRSAVHVLDCGQDLERDKKKCREVRQVVGWSRILAVTRERSSRGRAMMFESGADLVLSEPFVARELLACVHALTWRGAGECDWPTTGAALPSETAQESLRYEPLVAGTPLKDLARALRLTETERLLLRTLCTAKTPVAVARLREEVFPDAYYAADSSHLRVHIHRLRVKLGRAGLNVEGLHGRGYRLVDPHLDPMASVPSTP